MIALLPFLASVLSLIAGLFFGNQAKHYPKFFWTYLLIGLVLTTPLNFGGYIWYDQIFASGYLIANLPGRIRIKRNFQNILFLIFSVYMLVQAVRGIVFFSQFGPIEAARKVRWVFMFAVIFLLFVKSTSAKIESVFDKDLAYKLTIAGCIFNVIYLVFGLVSIYSTGSTGFTQFAQISDIYRAGTSPFLAIFGSTGYVVSVYFVIIPATLITIKNNNWKHTNFAWFVLALSFLVQVLYNSRSGMLIIVAFTALFILQNFRNRRVIKGLIVFIPLVGLAILFQILFNEVSITFIFQDLLNTVGLGDPVLYNPDLKDIDRKIWNFSAILALTDNPYNLFFGWGIRTSGYIVSPYVYDLFLEARGSAFYQEDVATPGFAALAVDTGMIGLLLIFSLLASCLAKIYRQPHKVDLFILFAPILFVLHLFVMNISNVMLLYLALMPNGLYLALGKYKNQ
jgi:hypothetical protein